MSVSINEFKANIEQYLLLAKTEDLFIRLDGDVIMRLTNTKRDRWKIAESLLVAVPADISLEQSRNMNAGDL